jgi:hypothetical protein
MNAKRLLLVGVCSLLLVGGWALAEVPANAGFEKLKTLIGQWEVTTPNGMHGTVRYELVSDGSAVLERISGDEHAMDMVTVYHPDGARLVMTHYCSAGNQPRMRAEAASGEVKKLDFRFLDATNLAGADAGHMHGLVVSFEDADHFSQEWRWLDHGKESAKVFHWARKK